MMKSLKTYGLMKINRTLESPKKNHGRVMEEMEKRCTAVKSRQVIECGRSNRRRKIEVF